MIRDMLAREGGIRLYRNGYRVLPYGEFDNDWLGLDQMYAKRSETLAPIANRNFLGFIEVEDQEGRIFEETSSREGLIENDAFQELQEIISAVLVTAINRIAEARERVGRKKRRPPREGASATSGQESAQALQATMQSLLKTVDKTTAAASQLSSDGPAAATKTVSAAQVELVQQVKELATAAQAAATAALERDELAAEVNFLRILASMGLTIAEFTHEFAAQAQAFELELKALVPPSPSSFRNRVRSIA